MMTLILLKGVAIWCIMVLMAILNGLLRDELLTPLLGSSIALPTSGITLSLLIILVAYTSIAFIGITRPVACLLIGLLWLLLTLVFEYGFGHYVAGKSWAEINQVFNVPKGNLFLVVLVITAISPCLAARLKRLM